MGASLIASDQLRYGHWVKPAPVFVIVLVAGLVVLTASGCVAPNASDVPDASSPASYLPAAPAPVSPPSPVVLTPCPAGWADYGSGATGCEPWPTGRSTCGSAQAQWPGASTCEPVGVECPAGEWPESLPAGVTVVYVRAGAPTGGTGTKTQPYASVTTAVAAAAPGSIVAIAKGVYADEQVVLRERVTLWGACAGQVTLGQPVFSNSSAVVNVIGPGNVARALTVSGARPGVWVEGATAALEVHGVVVQEATLAGVLVRAGAELRGDALVIRGTRPQIGTGVSGRGLSVEAGGRATLEKVLLERNTDYGVLLMDMGSSLTLSDAAIVSTSSRLFDGRSGQGLGVLRGTNATLTRTVLLANQECGVFVQGRLDASHVVIRESKASVADPDTGFGVVVTRAGSVTFQRSLIERSRGFGLFAEDPGTRVELTDVVVRDTEASGPGVEGGGIGLAGEVQATLLRVALERNVAFGLTAQNEGTAVTATDLTVRDTGPEPRTRTFGFGFEISLGASANVERVLVVGSRTAGILVDRTGHLTLSDAEVRETLPAALDDEGGFGLAVQEGARVEANRVLLVGNRATGLLVSEPGTQVTMADLVVRDTSGRVRQGDFGYGVLTQSSARLTLERTVLEDNLAVGLLSNLAQVSATDLVVRNTRSFACAPAPCPTWGVGLASVARGNVVVERFLLTRNANIGAQVASEASIDLAVGEVSWQPIGVSVAGDYDLGRLQRDVVYVNNESKLSADVVPLPSTPIPLSPTLTPR